jgi:hypothetical protein
MIRFIPFALPISIESLLHESLVGDSIGFPILCIGASSWAIDIGASEVESAKTLRSFAVFDDSMLDLDYSCETVVKVSCGYHPCIILRKGERIHSFRRRIWTYGRGTLAEGILSSHSPIVYHLFPSLLLFVITEYLCALGRAENQKSEGERLREDNRCGTLVIVCRDKCC